MAASTLSVLKRAIGGRSLLQASRAMAPTNATPAALTRSANCFFFSTATAGEASAGGKGGKAGIVEKKPSPTAYNPTVQNAAINPEPGKPSNGLPTILALSVAMVVFPCAISWSNVNAYYKATEHLYRDGWSVFHYDHGKNTYLS